MKSVKLCILLLACLMTVGFSACGSGTSSAPTTATTTTVWAASNPTPRDLRALLTEEEAESAMDTAFDQAELLENGSTMLLQSADFRDRVELLLDEQPQSRFDEVIALYEEGTLTETPNLGDIAYWNVGGELLVYAKGYMLEVNVKSGHLSDAALLTAARQMAALIIERL